MSGGCERALRRSGVWRVCIFAIGIDCRRHIDALAALMDEYERRL
ncbi:MAG: hypothetical protein ACI4L8_02440 [Candidatus Fimadaptatus sp.]